MAAQRPPRQLVLTASQAAHRAGVPLRTVRHWIASGKLRGRTLPDGQVRIAPIDLGHVVAARTRAAQAASVAGPQTPDAVWQRRFEALRAYKRQHRTLVLRGHLELQRWCALQRKLHARGALAPEREAALEKLGFVWDPRAALWEERYAELARFKTKHGHLRVPDGVLGDWCTTQRRFRAEGRLSPERVRKLDALGFAWDARQVLWEAQLERLRVYVARRRSLETLWRDDAALASWVDKQRAAWRGRKLTPDQQRKLRTLGVTREAPRGWEYQYKRLRAFWKKHGHADVPPRMADLFDWCVAQRTARRKGMLSPQRIRKLEWLGFTWSPQDALWMRRFLELKDYVAEHGHADVPTLKRGLGRWVRVQRLRRTRGQLKDWRKQLLNQVGFRWRLRAPAHAKR